MFSSGRVTSTDLPFEVTLSGADARTRMGLPANDFIEADSNLPSFHEILTSKPPLAYKPVTEPVGQEFGKAGSKWISSK